jgi:hypothetical protein
MNTTVRDLEKDADKVNKKIDQGTDPAKQLAKFDKDAQVAISTATVDSVVAQLRKDGYDQPAQRIQDLFGDHPGAQDDASEGDIDALLASLFGGIGEEDDGE